MIRDNYNCVLRKQTYEKYYGTVQDEIISPDL